MKDALAILFFGGFLLFVFLAIWNGISYTEKMQQETLTQFCKAHGGTHVREYYEPKGYLAVEHYFLCLDDTNSIVGRILIDASFNPIGFEAIGDGRRMLGRAESKGKN